MNGRHSAVKKSKRSTSHKTEVKQTKKNKEGKIHKDDLNETEVVVNIPVLDSTANKENRDRNNEKRKKKMNKILRIILIILIIILVVFVTIFARYVIKNGGDVKAAVKEMFRDAVGDQDPIFVLVMGISEDISAELTDTIMLIGYNPDTNQAFVLSIPRDTYTGSNINKGAGGDKINALYQINKKNPEKTIAAVENLTGVNIDYYVIVKTSVLVNIVDTIGGVDFDVPVDMDYDDDSQDLHIHLKAGYQTLNGDQAEQLVRFRHNNNNTSYPASYGDNDEGRTRTQREFMKVVAQKVLQTRDIDKIKSIAKDIFDNLETNIKWDQAVGYIPYAIDFNMEELEMSQLPGEMIKTTLWFFKPDNQKSKEVVDSYIQKLGLTDAEKKKYLKSNSSGTKSIPSITTKKNSDNNDSSNKNKNTTKNTMTDTNKNTNTTKSTNTKKTTTEKSTTKKNETSNTTKENDTDEESSGTKNSSSNDNDSGSTSNSGSASESGSSGGSSESGSENNETPSSGGNSGSSGGSSGESTGGGSSNSGSESGGDSSSPSSSTEQGNKTEKT